MAKRPQAQALRALGRIVLGAGLLVVFAGGSLLALGLYANLPAKSFNRFHVMANNIRCGIYYTLYLVSIPFKIRYQSF